MPTRRTSRPRKHPTLRRILNSRIVDWLLFSRVADWLFVPLLGTALSFGGAAIGLINHPIVTAVAISMGSTTYQSIRAIINRRRKKKAEAGITGYAQGGHIR